MSNLLMAAFLEENNDGRITVSCSPDGSKWCSTETPQSSAAGPALGLLNGNLWAAFGGKSDQKIYTAGLADWSANDSVGQGSSLAPSLAEFNGKLWVAYIGDSTGHLELVSKPHGGSWSGKTDTGHSSKAAPSLTAFSGNLYGGFRGDDSTELYVASSADWQQKKAVGQSSRLAPALAVHQTKLWMAYIGDASGNVEVVWSQNGTDWSRKIDTGQSSDLSPSMAVFGNDLWIAYIGKKTGHVELISSSSGTGGWSAKIDTGKTSSQTPALAVIAAAVPPTPFAGFYQYVFAGPVERNKPYVALKDLMVEIKIIDALKVDPLSGVTPPGVTPPNTTPYPIGFQINGFSQKGDSTICWQQYGVRMSPGANTLISFAEGWPAALNTNSKAPNVYNLTSNDQSSDSGVTLPDNLTVPAGWTIKFVFDQKSDGTIKGFKCSVTDEQGNSKGTLDLGLLGKPLAVGGGKKIKDDDLAVMVAFQVVLVAFANKHGAILDSGSGRITCSSSTLMTPQVPWPADAGGANGTAEEANSTYTLVPAEASRSIAQCFGVKRP